MKDYFDNLSIGSTFCKNNIYESIIYKYAISNNNKTLVVLSTSEGVKKYELAKVTFTNGKFVHENAGSFFKEDGGLKYFILTFGDEWTGG